MNVPSTEKLTLTVSRIIRAQRSRVFAAFSSVEDMKQWFGPEACRVTDGEMDFRQGRTYRLSVQTTEFGPAELCGTFQEIQRDRRLRYTWTWGKNAIMEPWGEMMVTVEFVDHPVDHPRWTLVTILHEGLVSPEVREGHNHGWNGSLDKLAARVGGSSGGGRN